MNRKVTCALCKRDYPASECEQSVRGYECRKCIDRKLRLALRRLDAVRVDRDGSIYGTGETDASTDDA